MKHGSPALVPAGAQHCRTLEKGNLKIQIALENACKCFSAELLPARASTLSLVWRELHQRDGKLLEFKEEG